MTGEHAGGAPRGADLLRSAAVAGLVLALTAVAVSSHHEGDEARRAHEAEAVAGAVASGTGVDLGRGLREVVLAAADVSAIGLGALVGGPDDFAPGATDIGFEIGDPAVPPSPGEAPLTTTERADPAIAALLDRARDSGSPQLSGPVDRPGGERTLIVAAVYRGAEEPGPPVTAVDRRARLAGWVVAAVDLSALAASHAPEGTAVTVRDAGAGGADPGSGGTDEQQEVRVADRVLLVAAETPDAGEVSTTTVLIGLAGALLAAAAGAYLMWARDRHRTARARADEAGAQVRLIGEIAPLVQQSLELSEVLPAVAVQLTDHFDLAGIRLSTGSSRAGQTELFSMGVAPDATQKPVLHPPAELAAGTTLRLALQRGGRSVALLQVVAGRDLDLAELESLRALSELVTAAMVNASLYASQQEALKRMRELDSLKTVFLGTASHELRTPATAIAGFAGLLTSSWDRFTDEQRRDFVERIGANARSLSTVVQDLLDFSLLDRGTLAVHLAPLDLGEVVGGVIDRLAGAFGDHEVEADLQPTRPIAGDQSGIERITTNLLTNAVKFSPEGTTIRVTVRQDGDDALLQVSDQGPGVPQDERERVFARFYRGAGDAVIQTRGVGIGLSVVSEFVARMDGTVQVDDAPGGGARFTVRIPAAAPETLQEVADATTP